MSLIASFAAFLSPRLLSGAGGTNAKSPTRKNSNLRLDLIIRLLVLALLLPCSAVREMTAQTKTAVYSLEIKRDDQFPKDIHFYCFQKYNLEECKRDVLLLRNELGRFPIGGLSWSFILVSSEDWQRVLRAAGGPPGSPAFSALHSRYSFFTQALFAPTKLQEAELTRLFRRDRKGLFRFVVAHELAHALCAEANEVRADAYARELLAGKAFHCKDEASRVAER